MKNLILILGLFLIAPTIHAIGRTGNSEVQSLTDGFSAQVPVSFTNIQEFGADSIRALGPIVIGVTGAFQQQYIEMYPLAAQYPLFITTSRSQFEKTLGNLGWTALNHPDPCISAFRIESQTAYTYVVSWGDGHGYVAVGQNTPIVLEALEHILSTTELFAGVCSWK